MKIGIYCTNNYPYPVPAGTIYANMTVAGELADALTHLGADITFFAPLGTKTQAKLITFDMLPFCDPKIYGQYRDKDASYDYEDLMVAKMLNYMEERHFDILHTHTRPMSIVRFAVLKPRLPTVVTVHDPLSYPGYNLLPRYHDFGNLYFTSLTNAQRQTRPQLPWRQTVYNGVNLNKWPFQRKAGKYLLFVGRLTREKGIDLAVAIARQSNLPLKIAGTIYKSRKKFFDQKIKPFLGKQIEYLGPVPREKLPVLYQNAAALLAPIRWSEPFGLVFIEAMACGTPVIATNLGSVPEVIVNNKTGYIIPHPKVPDFVEAVKNIGRIDRAACREHIENNFTLEKTAQNYFALYNDILGR